MYDGFVTLYFINRVIYSRLTASSRQCRFVSSRIMLYGIDTAFGVVCVGFGGLLNSKNSLSMLTELDEDGNS